MSVGFEAARNEPAYEEFHEEDGSVRVPLRGQELDKNWMAAFTDARRIDRPMQTTVQVRSWLAPPEDNRREVLGPSLYVGSSRHTPSGDISTISGRVVRAEMVFTNHYYRTEIPGLFLTDAELHTEKGKRRLLPKDSPPDDFIVVRLDQIGPTLELIPILTFKEKGLAKLRKIASSAGDLATRTFRGR